MWHHITILSLLLLVACSSSPTSSNDGVNRDLAALRAATSRFQVFDTAVAAGYSTKLTACMTMPPLGDNPAGTLPTGIRALLAILPTNEEANHAPISHRT